MWYLYFWVWLPSVSVMTFGFHPLSCKCHDFILLHGCMEFHCAYVTHSLYPSSADGHVGWFHFLPIVTRVAVNMDAQVSLRCPILESPGYAPGFNFLIVFVFLRQRFTMYPWLACNSPCRQLVTAQGGCPMFSHLAEGEG